MATVWRWPPDRLATGMRTEGILALSWRSSRQDSCSIVDLVERAAAVELAAEEQVGDDVEVVAQREVLEHGRDAEPLGLGRAGDAGPALPSNVIVPSSGV